MLNDDYKDMLRALSGEKVEFLLVGAYAMAAHGHVRATGDMDIWVMPSPENAQAVLRAPGHFGTPLFDLTAEDLQKEGTVFQIGVAPRRVDILTAATGLRFQDAFARSICADIDGIEVHILSREDLIANKRATGRTKDLGDAEALEALDDAEGD
jgi:hypothetical protein